MMNPFHGLLFWQQLTKCCYLLSIYFYICCCIQSVQFKNVYIEIYIIIVQQTLCIVILTYLETCKLTKTPLVTNIVFYAKSGKYWQKWYYTHNNWVKLLRFCTMKIYNNYVLKRRGSVQVPLFISAYGDIP